MFLVGCLLAAALAGCGTGEQDTEEKEYAQEADFAEADIALPAGTAYDQAIMNLFPEAEVKYYSQMADILLSLEQGKADGFVVDYSFYVAMKWETDSLGYVDMPSLENVNYGMVFAQGEENQLLKTQINEFIAASQEDGTLKELQEIWFSDAEPQEDIDRTLTGENGVLRLGCNSECKPFAYMKNGRLTGHDIDLLYRFCREYGYGLEMTDLAFASIIPGVMSGKFDLGACGFTITEERAQSVDFSDVYCRDRVVMAIWQEGAKGSFLEGLLESVEKTFVRESRWQLILQGVGTTLLLTLLSTALGTALGFGLYLPCRTGNRAFRLLAAVYIRLMEGIPVVVLLMILYYVVFGKTDLDGLWVAVVGFALTTGAFVLETMKVSVEGVDKGQREAALALGYRESRAFFRIILPQAMRQFLPAWQGEIVSLIKGTAVVGYIAVQDLTKMSDIIRSSTYEAFFPLIATALIYFLLTWALALAIGRLRLRLAPRRG